MLKRHHKTTHHKKTRHKGPDKRRGDYHYLIELRMGTLRPVVGTTVDHVKSKFRLRSESPETPHLSLYGSFRIKSGYRVEDVMSIIKATADSYSKLPYWVDGWDYKEGNSGQVVAFKIEPSKDLKKFTETMVQELWRVTEPKNDFDYHPENAWYHITVAYKLNNQMFARIKSYLEPNLSTNSVRYANKTGIFSKLLALFRFKGPKMSVNDVSYPNHVRRLHLPVDALRVTIIDKSKIKYEYDLATKRWLQRFEAKSSTSWAKTLQQYRLMEESEIYTQRYFSEPKLFTIGDLHLGHANIIKYCCRPFLFKDVREMDRVLIRNWNYTVKPEDYVYYLGDLALNNYNPNKYLQQLNGRKALIQGNHDKYLANTVDHLRRNIDGIDLLFIHDPKDKPDDFNGWVIHGHVHNSNLKRFPFFNPNNRTINVSVEAINYKPVPVSTIISLIKNQKESISRLSDL